MSADVWFAVDAIARDGGIRACGYSSRNMRRKFVTIIVTAKLRYIRPNSLRDNSVPLIRAFKGPVLPTLT